MRRVLIILLVAIIIGGGTFFGVRILLTKQRGVKAGLKVTSTPTTSVFLDNRNIGRTPFEDKLEAGEYTLKLIPETTEGEIASWQGKVKLTPNLLTYVNRELGKTELNSAGEILTLEKINDDASEIAVITEPDGAKVKLDGIERGTSPILDKKIEPGDHELSIESPGFEGRSIKILTTGGFKLTADVKLKLIEEATPSAKNETEKKEGTKNGEAKQKVKILDTPTGWLRVRSEPTTASTESAKVNPGETYSLIDEKSGWYKIVYEEGKTGWISGRYAKKIE